MCTASRKWQYPSQTRCQHRALYGNPNTGQDFARAALTPTELPAIMQSAITKDNVSLMIDGVLFVKVCPGTRRVETSVDYGGCLLRHCVMLPN